MLRVLLPTDGSDNAMRALEHVVNTRDRYREPLELHVVNVQRRVASGAVRMFISADVLDDYYREEGDKALASSRAYLRQAGVAFESHIAVGDEAESIAHYAKEHACDFIVMGTRGMGRLGSLVLGSVAARVIHFADTPVMLIK